MCAKAEWKPGDKCAVSHTNYRFRAWYFRGVVTRVTKTLIFVRHNNSEQKFRKGDDSLCEFTPEIEAEIKRQTDSYRLIILSNDEWRNMSGDKLARIVAILEEK